MTSEERVISSLATADIGVADTGRVEEAMEVESEVHSCNKINAAKRLMRLTVQGPGKTQIAQPNGGQEFVEYDVSICDICGDKGREEKLAICSHCSDGAEHIYCMRIKLDKIPEGNWMCEACSLQQDYLREYKHKFKRPMRISRLSQERPRIGISGPSKGKHGSKLEVRPSHSGKTRADMVSSTLHLPAVKRHALNSEMKQVKTETTKANSSTFHGSSKLHGKSLFYSESPSKSLGKRKLHAVSQSGKSLGEVPERKIGSSSCPKKLAVNVDEDIQYESQKTSLLGKQIPSDNFKESKTKTRKIITCTDKSRSDSQRNEKIRSGSCQPKSGNLQGVFSETKRRTFQETNPRSVSRVPSMNLDKGKMKAGHVGSLSKEKSAGIALSRTQLPSPSQEPQKLVSERFLSKSKSLNIVESPKNQELSSSSSAVLRRLKSDGNSVCDKNGSGNSLKMMHRSFPYHKPSSSESKLKSSEDSRKPSHGNERGSTKRLVLQSPVSVPMNTHAEKNQKQRATFSETSHAGPPNSHKFAVPKVLGNLNAPTKPEIPFVGEDISCENKQSSENSLAEHNMGATSVSYARHDLSHLKPLKEELLSCYDAIPFPYYIWIGSFQMLHSDGVQTTCDGIAGHLSSQASSRVVEVIHFLPKCLILEAAARLEIWPPQFIQSPPTEYNIALFFFADSLFSYTRNYRPLLDLMINSDLALRGHFNGLQLLIFPSNLLPKQSQRWNAAYYLWGVFRGKKPPTIDMPANNFKREDGGDTE